MTAPNPLPADHSPAYPPDFFARLMKHHREGGRYPPTEYVVGWATRLLYTLFPQQAGRCVGTPECLQAELGAVQAELRRVLTPLGAELPAPAEALTVAFMAQLPAIFDTLMTDAQATLDGDPAAHDLYEVIRAYPGFYATAMHRFAHALHALQVPLLPRLISEHAHSRTGIDIHPAARIGPRLCIDHGSGVVVGETAVLGEGVKLYQGVTLGALSVSKEQAGKQRHPTLEDGVVVYAGATILGGDTVVGARSVVGGNVWLTHSVPQGSLVLAQQRAEVKPLRSTSGPSRLGQRGAATLPE